MSKAIKDFKELKSLKKALEFEEREKNVSNVSNKSQDVINQDNPSHINKMSQERRSRIVKVPEHKPKSPIATGTRVALKNFTEKGTIVSYDNGVFIIELDGGLPIPAGKDEFVVIDANAYQSDKMPSQSKSVSSKTKIDDKVTGNGAYANQISVDLHIGAISGGRNIPKNQCLTFQLDRFRAVMNANLRHRGRKIQFIHGHGEGILRNEIIKLLDEMYALRCTYNSSDFAVITVTIK